MDREINNFENINSNEERQNLCSYCYGIELRKVHVYLMNISKRSLSQSTQDIALPTTFILKFIFESIQNKSNNK